MGRKKTSARGGDDEQQPAASSLVGVAKSKKKSVQIDDDEYSIGTELSEEPKADEDKVVITGKKKGKKGNKKGTQQDDDDGDFAVEEDDVPEIAFVGKKKSKAKKGGAVSFALLDDEADKEEADDNESDGDKEDEPVISLTGKKHASKKGKKGGNSFAASAFDALGGDDNDDDEEVNNGDEEEVSPITFSGKKKKSSKSSKKSTNLFSAALLDEEEETDASTSRPDENALEDEESTEITFSGKKKSSKKKGSSVLASLGDDSVLGKEVADETSKTTTSDTKSVEVVEPAKSKKKKKNNKSGRTVQEEDDLDKLLAELGETPAAGKPASSPPEEEKVQAQPDTVAPVEDAGEKEGEEDTVETAAAKKRKKKKEKEKEKKAAAAAATSSVEAKEEKQEESVAEPLQPKKKDAKAKAAEKKVPKHVKEMQEALARRQEAEERKKKEEEEKLRKEEEERLRQEELEKQAEEAKRKKKEKEKEKLLRKKLEGKLLTAKQKAEALKREVYKNQLMAAGGGLPVADEGEPSSKRPIYANKKKSARQKVNDSASGQAEEEDHAEEADTLREVGSRDTEKVDLIEPADTDEKSGPADVAQENGVEEDDEDEEWDAKSWDDVNVTFKGDFDDEEEEPQLIVKKEIKDVESKTHDSDPEAGKPTSKAAGAANPTAPDTKTLPEVEDATRTKRANRAKDASKKGKGLAPSEPKEGEENLRSPICCIMGHVDTGKTKLLDCIRGTNVQEGEAGGITQQIGATYFPAENIRERTRELKADAILKVPGLLVIDTPGHESFTNLRSRGSSLCDLAILVVDIMHGLEPQTIESLNLLRMRDTEFIVALNKVDRLYGWKTCKNAPIVKAMKQQTKDVKNEFERRLTEIITEFKMQGLNTELYYKNKEMGETYSIVPTSAISGEGIPDLLLLLVNWAQKTMVEKLTYVDDVQCTVLEVKVIEGHGTTIDVVLVNGVLHEGDQIVVCGLQAIMLFLFLLFQGPIVTTIRALLTPHPMKELRVKGTYVHHKEIKAAQGIKITAQGLEHAIAGTALHVIGPDDDIEAIKDQAMEDMESIGTPICVPSREFIDIGRIASIENNHKPVDYAKKGTQVAIKIIASNPEEQKMFGRHFDMEDELVSHISRKSIDILKTDYRDELSMDEWKLVVKLKNIFKIQ
ncbi:unnamed protein product [Thlaspi arvense]|uniref:Tr-type G domain-containing protein n=1 Tax=Thlaspi arvense TaxID=13288 RepID=A0AAU9SNW9_THLAR|nr:unnamed protein product [Thlaspi arvense]